MKKVNCWYCDVIYYCVFSFPTIHMEVEETFE